MLSRIINRSSEPGKYDECEFKTICRVNDEVYVQVSHNSDTPKWERIGDLHDEEALRRLIHIIESKD